ncbi:hypothetical protein NG798_02625 [Ancylothrix sp. C2]|uniref:hypothetical protein n=1 Tax=Ancylothrix sp. D3o TaxID=2953691 RepID=UPI0021BAECB7|nr:hypothetical protein [Ancylothrix sp. D3o]MCT7948675.1 hypothetical protein [Ancylothrix sp. D3o]
MPLLLPSAVSELFAEVTTSGRVTIADRYGLMAALLDESLDDEARYSIDRLLRAVCRGRVQIVNELSAVI